MGFWILVVSNIVTWLAIVVLFLSLRIVGTKLGTMVLDADGIARLAVDKSTENSVVLIRAGLARLTSDDPKKAKLVYQPPGVLMYKYNLSDEDREKIRKEIEKMRGNRAVLPSDGKTWTEHTYADKTGTFADMTGKFSEQNAYASHPEASMFPWGY